MVSASVWHEHELMKWILIEPRGDIPSARYGHTAVIHTCTGSPKMLIFGGYRKSTRLNDVYEYDTELQKWRCVPLRGTFPGPRDCHSAVLYRERFMIVFGGANGQIWLNDTYQYDILTEEWSLLVPSTNVIPQGRAGHSVVLLDDELIVTAGWMGSRTLQDCWKFNLCNQTWEQVLYASAAPRPRDSHTSIIYYDKSNRPLLYLFGGGSSSKRHTGICVFDFQTQTWTTLKNEYFLRLAGHDVIQTPDHKCIFFGGGDGVSWKRSLVQYDLRSDQWHKLKTTERREPPGAYGLSFVLYQVKSRLRALCWGGGNGDNFYADLYELDLTNRFPPLMVRDQFCDCVVVTQDKDALLEEMQYSAAELFVGSGALCMAVGKESLCHAQQRQSSSSAPSPLPNSTAALSGSPQKPTLILRHEPQFLPPG